MAGFGAGVGAGGGGGTGIPLVDTLQGVGQFFGGMPQGFGGIPQWLGDQIGAPIAQGVTSALIPRLDDPRVQQQMAERAMARIQGQAPEGMQDYMAMLLATLYGMGR